MGRIINVENDKRLECGANPPDFFTMLASCIVRDTSSGNVYLNTICYDYDCEDEEPVIDCTIGPPMDPQKFCAANLFTVDECGRLAFKIGYCLKLEDLL
jgi:hypothetical protein